MRKAKCRGWRMIGSMWRGWNDGLFDRYDADSHHVDDFLGMKPRPFGQLLIAVKRVPLPFLCARTFGGGHPTCLMTHFVIPIGHFVQYIHPNGTISNSRTTLDANCFQGIPSTVLHHQGIRSVRLFVHERASSSVAMPCAARIFRPTIWKSGFGDDASIRFVHRVLLLLRFDRTIQWTRKPRRSYRA